LYITNNQATPLLYGQFHSTPSDNKLGMGTKSIPAGDTIAVWNGAHLAKGGVWTNASSREMKDNIVSLTAEDVPELVATSDHKSLSVINTSHHRSHWAIRALHL
jgi:hypothetical protein